MLSELRSVAYLSDPQTLRSFCDVPVAVMLGSVDRGLLHTLALQWKAEGRQLFVVSQFPETIRQSFVRARVHSTPRRVNAHLLEQTLTRRPSRYRHEVFQLSAAAVPDAPAPAPPGAQAQIRRPGP
jgi:hypothetical protein